MLAFARVLTGVVILSFGKRPLVDVWVTFKYLPHWQFMKEVWICQNQDVQLHSKVYWLNYRDLRLMKNWMKVWEMSLCSKSPKQLLCLTGISLNTKAKPAFTSLAHSLSLLPPLFFLSLISFFPCIPLSLKCLGKLHQYWNAQDRWGDILTSWVWEYLTSCCLKCM